jgi:hypothetical protein
VAGILVAAGFSGISAEPLEMPLRFGADVDAAVALALEIGPPARAVREAGPAARNAAEPLLRDLFARHLGPHGVTLDGAAWLFRAVASGS